MPLMIIQKPILQRGDNAPLVTIVKNIEGYKDDLTQHPCIVNHPEQFEVVDFEIEEGTPVQYLIYKNNENEI